MIKEQENVESRNAAASRATASSPGSSRSTPHQPVENRPNSGPFYVGVASAAVAGALLISLACGLPVTLLIMLSVIIPGMIVATVLLSVSMGWIFIMHGRTKQIPRWVGGTAFMIGITMAELFALTYIASLTPAKW